MNIPAVFWLVPVASIVALSMAWFFFKSMMKADEGTPRMKEIALYVRKGAMAYLKQQYRVVCIVFVVLCALFAFMAYGLNVQNPWVPFAFLTGGFFSGLAGFFGMKTATYASARTANAARQSMDAGLKIAFRSGAVMGLTVVGLGLLDIAIWFLVLNHFYSGDEMALITITTTMLTFGMGASTQALFARVGGGIYTKAADVGADIVGKVEADIPEDDPRNPATIADNVGDNVGDVAGMGADLYESYCGSILSTAALGAAAFGVAGIEIQLKAVIAPMLIASVGVFLSLFGIFLVRTKEGATMKDLLRSLALGTNVSAVLIAIATFAILYLLGIENWLGLSFSVISGLAAGVIIGQATEYYTSHSYKPTQKLPLVWPSCSAICVLTALTSLCHQPASHTASMASVSLLWACSPRWVLPSPLMLMVRLPTMLVVTQKCAVWEKRFAIVQMRSTHWATRLLPQVRALPSVLLLSQLLHSSHHTLRRSRLRWFVVVRN